ncbi:phage tail protein [Lysinibacillus sp. M3]|uniref:Phage tail protein n=1 Tax=Lysinibacillus zambalensis TaxID=3160866 RepID=A0ABV1MXE8_9BACI
MSNLVFKAFNSETGLWEDKSIHNPDLISHAGAKASIYQAGHVQLTSALDSESEVLAPTAKALKTVFDSVGVHVNEKDIHLTQTQIDTINLVPTLQAEIKALQAEVQALKGQTPTE